MAVVATLLLVVGLLLGGGDAFQSPLSPSVRHFRRGGVVAAGSGCDVPHHPLNALPTSRRECLALLTSAAVAAAPESILTTSLQPAFAASLDVGLDYVGVYTDPKHPAGYRVLLGDMKSASLRLQDDPDGQTYNLPVRVDSSSDGDASVVEQLTFDFSPKDGPSDITGVFSRDREGIPILSFPDGNAWKKRETGPVGVYRDASDPAKFVVIRQSKGRELSADIVRKGGETKTIKATAGNPTILFEFSEGAAVPGAFSSKKKTISFEDGNVWTKF